MGLGIRPDSTIGFLVLGALFAAFGAWRLVNEERIGWFLIAAGALAIAGAWWRISHPSGPPED